MDRSCSPRSRLHRGSDRATFSHTRVPGGPAPRPVWLAPCRRSRPPRSARPFSACTGVGSRDGSTRSSRTRNLKEEPRPGRWSELGNPGRADLHRRGSHASPSCPGGQGVTSTSAPAGPSSGQMGVPAGAGWVEAGVGGPHLTCVGDRVCYRSWLGVRRWGEVSLVS
jgi:hypothetical protein